MATDATGTPTAKGIPKFNTAVDKPSGVGSNAQMDAIDALFDSYVSKPSGIVSGEVPVWNGTTWVRSSVTRIGVGSLGSGSPSSSTYLRGDGTWASVAAGPGYGTSLPGSPTDGQEYILVDSTSAPTYAWYLRYNSGSASSYKWEWVGGTPAHIKVDANQTTQSTSYVDVTNGPSFTIPNAGDWLITVGGLLSGSGDNGTGQMAYLGYPVGATSANDVWAASAVMVYVSGGGGASAVCTHKHTAVSASSLVKAQFKRGQNGVGTNLNAQNRFLIVQPIRIS